MNRLIVSGVLLLGIASAVVIRMGNMTPVESDVVVSTPKTVNVVNLASEMVDYSHRGDYSVSRDVYRHPFETLKFFGVKPDDKVVEILPGGGWYTEILAPKLKKSGLLVAAHYPKVENDETYRTKSRIDYEDDLRRDLDVYGEVLITDFTPSGKVSEIAKESDFVLTFRSLHGLHNKGKLPAALKQFSSMLKKGGRLGVVQHEAPEGSVVDKVSLMGYLPKSYVIEQAQDAGFVLVAESAINNNPKDIIIQEGIETGVWSLPPSLRDVVDVEKFEAIGESNRMTLLFEKK